MLPGEILRKKIITPLRKLLDELKDLNILIVPSIRDITSDHVSFPQKAFVNFPPMEVRCRLFPAMTRQTNHN